MSIKQDFRVNDQIMRMARDGRPRDVRVIDSEGNALGIMSVREAQEAAQAQGMDLIEVAPNAQPSVCRIMDYGRYRYEQDKKDREQHKKHKQQDLKGIKMRPGTAEHDFQVRLRNTLRFLEDGDKVKVTIQFKGREITHPEIGREQLDKLVAALGDRAQVEKPPSIEGKFLTVILSPKSQNG